MLSLSRHLDAFDIAQEVRLERKVHKGSFLFVEGGTDVKRFTPFVDESACSIVNSWGRDNALEATKMLADEGFLGVVACVDADFDRELHELDVHECIVYSESHDLDMDWATEVVLSRYFVEMGEPEKLASFRGGVTEIADRILSGLRVVSTARLLNRLGVIREKLSDLNISSDFQNLSITVEAYSELVKSKRNLTNDRTTQIANLIRGGLTRNHDLRQITNGHDFHCALGVGLRSDLGSRRDVHTWGSEVEAGLRLCFSKSDLKISHVFAELRRWEEDNMPYKVFRLDA